MPRNREKGKTPDDLQFGLIYRWWRLILHCQPALSCKVSGQHGNCNHDHVWLNITNGRQKKRHRREEREGRRQRAGGEGGAANWLATERKSEASFAKVLLGMKPQHSHRRHPPPPLRRNRGKTQAIDTLCKALSGPLWSAEPSGLFCVV